MTALLELFNSIWNVFKDASLYLLIGYGLATVLHIYLDPRRLVAMLGDHRFGAIVKATLYGIPLPLCSCAVIPSTITLKKKGVSNGATIAYLIATPESGIDSIAITYGLLGGAFTAFRVISAFCIAITTGSLIELVEGFQSTPPEEPEKDCGHQGPCDCRKSLPNTSNPREWIKLFIGNFHDLFDETAAWLLIGLILSGLIDFFIPVGFFQERFFSGFLSYLLMLSIGLPMYICASASTPIAAMLVYKGLSPGAALVFLLAGPATNIGSLVLLIRTFGKKIIYCYLTALSILTLSAGFALDNLQSVFPVDLTNTFAQTDFGEHTVIESICSILFLILMANSFYRSGSFRKAGEYLEKQVGKK